MSIFGNTLLQTGILYNCGNTLMKTEINLSNATAKKEIRKYGVLFLSGLRFVE